MSSFVQQALLATRLPRMQFQRFRAKINIQRPKKPHYERAKVLAVTAPVYPEKDKTLTCFKPTSERYNTKVQNPYNDIIAREVFNWLEHSRMVGIFHLNSITADDLFRARVELHKQNMHLKSYGRQILEKAMLGTKYEALLPLFVSYYCLVFSPQQNVKQMLRIVRKVPQMILVGGILEDTLLSRNEMVNFAQMPGLQAAQAELVSTLSMAGSSVVQQLEAHQKSLVNVLDVYAKGENGDKSESKEETGA